jgi:hypothetical protein
MSGPYLWLKLVHVIGACVLLGTGLGIAFFMWMAHRTADAGIIASTARIVVIADAVFTASAAIIQPLTGVALAQVMGFPLLEPWIVFSFGLYLFVGACGCRWCGYRSSCAISPVPHGTPAGRCRRNIGACSGSGWLLAGRPLQASLRSLR